MKRSNLAELAIQITQNLILASFQAPLYTIEAIVIYREYKHRDEFSIISIFEDLYSRGVFMTLWRPFYLLFGMFIFHELIKFPLMRILSKLFGNKKWSASYPLHAIIRSLLVQPFIVIIYASCADLTNLNSSKYGNLMDCITKIYQEQGYRGFFQGYQACIMLAVVSYYIFECIRTILVFILPNRTNLFYTVILNIINFGLTRLICFPLTVLQARSIISPKLKSATYKGMVDLIIDYASKGKILELYVGCSLKVMQAVVLCSIKDGLRYMEAIKTKKIVNTEEKKKIN